MEWKQAESKQSPALVDATSCPGKVYVRKDIREESRDEGTMFTYLEALMTPEEYQSYSGQRIEATGTNDNQTVIMAALADIADMILDLQMGGE
ncbi:MAG: hypothetical protein J6D57_10320 [Mogibacterium sp.]|nr:hypothetical protein [Mogibacterium sp.]